MSDDEIARMSWEGCPHHPEPQPDPPPPRRDERNGTDAVFYSMGLVSISLACSAGYLLGDGRTLAATAFGLAAVGALLMQSFLWRRR